LLGKHRVLKLKKPVDLGFLDYSTIEKRREACQAEVELNNRLCAGYYDGVQPISRIDGKLRFSSRGPVVEYGVMMKRLPTDLMLDHLLARGEVTEAIIERVANRLVEFHSAARRGPQVDAFGSPDVIAGNCKENFDQTATYVDRTIPAESFESICEWVNRWLREHRELLLTRVKEGRIRDGHGDIRAESICVTDGLCIFDCIEFNERFRFSDVASEVAFLAMDLSARGRPDLGYYFAEQYLVQSMDAELFKLLPFYRCYRAYIRGKVQSFRLDEAQLTALEREVVALRARRYFDIAARYASPLTNPSVIAVTGLSGTGKTSVARAIAAELGLRVVSSDGVRKSLYEIKDRQEYGVGPYSADANRLTYQALVEGGRDLLIKDGGVVLEATFRTKRRSLDRSRNGSEVRSEIDIHRVPAHAGTSAREVGATSGAQARAFRCDLGYLCSTGARV
jgi:aminoglycoside phosphotransferase family enzyme/predicted kinase